MKWKITYRTIFSILLSGLLFGFIKYMFEKAFTTSLILAALMFGVIFEILHFIVSKYLKSGKQVDENCDDHYLKN